MTSPRCYVVRWNTTWQHKPGWAGCQNFVAAPAYGVVRAFSSREAAEAFRNVREQRTRRRPPRRHPYWHVSFNPFWTVPTYEFDLAEVSSMEPAMFTDWLLDQGLTLPEPRWNPEKLRTPEWYDWWEEQHRQMSVLQRFKVWESLDRVRFFEIAEVEMGE